MDDLTSTPPEAEKPWKAIERTIDDSDVDSLEQALESLTASDTTRALAHLSQEDQTRLFQMLPADEAADVIRDVPEAQAADIMEHLTAGDAAAIVGEMSSDHAADVLAEMNSSTTAAILDALPPGEQAEARELLSYDENTAGGIMVKEFVSFDHSLKVSDVLRDLEEHADVYVDYDVQYSYVVDARRRLLGVLRLRDVVLAPRSTPIASLMIADPMSVPVDQELHDLHDLFRDHDFVGVPVVDADRRLLGVVLRDAVWRAEHRVAEETLLESAGIVGGEELRTMGLVRRSGRRLSWLSINIVLNVVAASVIAAYQETLSAVIVLAVFLPIISDMSGCSGNQAVAVSIRELTLGAIRPGEILRVVWKEGVVGVVNGCVLGVLLGTIAWLWQGNGTLGLVVGTALMANTIVAVVLGGVVPLVLSGLKQDPALASGPILTTVTDMCGFFFVLGLASAYLPRLAG